MGNRCVITTAPFDKKNIGIYLHWNGGIESVEAFVAAAKELNFRDPGDSYGMARLTSIIALYFGLTQDTSIGIDRCENLDLDGDNGVWLLDPNEWKITGWLPDSSARKARAPGKNPDPAKTEAIRKQIVIGARVCETACQKLTA